MDMKDAEKIEWEAMRQRYNRLMVYATEKGCNFYDTDLPKKIFSPVEAKELIKKKKQEQKGEQTSQESEGSFKSVDSKQLPICGNCGEKIGKLEESHLFKGNIVCTACNNKLMKSKSLETTVEKMPADLTITIPSGKNKE